MKRIFALTPLIGLILLMTSCVSTKKIVYFQGSDSIFSQAQDIMQQYEMKLKPADQILIKLTCSEPELLNIFAQDVVMGTAGSSISTNITNQGNMTNAYAYTVPNDGHQLKLRAGRDYLLQRSFGGALKRLLQKQIAASVAGQTQFGEHGELHAVAAGAAHGRYCGFRIVRAVRHAKRRRQSAGLYKAVYHKSITLCV